MMGIYTQMPIGSIGIGHRQTN